MENTFRGLFFWQHTFRGLICFKNTFRPKACPKRDFGDANCHNKEFIDTVADYSNSIRKYRLFSAAVSRNILYIYGHPFVQPPKIALNFLGQDRKSWCYGPSLKIDSF